jgi:hypothetical protein
MKKATSIPKYHIFTVSIVLLFMILALLLYVIPRFFNDNETFRKEGIKEPFFQEQDLQIYTVVTEVDHENLVKLKKSIVNMGEIPLKDVNVLVSKDPVGYQKGHGAKITLLYQALMELHDPKTLVMLVDGYDVLFCTPKREILDKYNAILAENPGKTIVFGAEMYCWPDKDMDLKYEEMIYKGQSVGPYKYLNSGTILGPAGDIIKLIYPMIHKVTPITDDQRFYTSSLLNDPETKIILDTKCQLFQCLASEMKTHVLWDAKEMRWYNIVTQTNPCLMHGNGDAKDFLFEDVYKALKLHLAVL